MDYSDFLELARSRQSIRRFEARPVDMRLVEDLLSAAWRPRSEFRYVARRGSSLTPWGLGRVYDGWRAGFCRTVCLAFERR